MVGASQRIDEVVSQESDNLMLPPGQGAPSQRIDDTSSQESSLSLLPPGQK